MKHIFVILFLSMGSLVVAHEGHNKTPGAISAPNGGQVKGTAHHYVEVLTTDSGVKFFITDHDFKPVTLSSLKVEAAITLPKKNKSEPVVVKQEDNFYSAVVDAKGAHRYSLELLVTYKDKLEKLKFNIEPQ